MANSPFDLSNESGYRAWRDARLAGYPRSVDELIVPLADPRHLTPKEIGALESRCVRANMAIYSAAHLPAAGKSIPHQLARQLGLVRLEGNYLADEDGLSSITPAGDAGNADEIRAPLRHRQFDAGVAQPDRPVRTAVDGHGAGRCGEGTACRAGGSDGIDCRLPPVSVRRAAQGRTLAA